MPDHVSGWLEQLGLGQYASNFIDNDIDVQLLTQLTDTDLKELGINSLGHRKKIIGAIETLVQAGPATIANIIPKDKAERRQLTVMFCDLMGSTALSQRLDPEDLREINRAYQDACKTAIERYEGYVARYMGDGVLAYFGFPQAHEDDAERAVHAGLAVVESVVGLDVSVGEAQNIELAVRVGIATGPVVVGDIIGEAASQESAVVGEAPNLAARLQALAPRNAVVIGPGTQSLVAGRFEYENLGDYQLKGISERIQAWRVIAAATADSRFAAAHQSDLTPMVGREHEIGLLLDRWEQAKDGDGQVVLLCGEAGIGKSRITETLHERVTSDDPASLRYQCSPYHSNSALYPIIEQLERTARFDPGDPLGVKLEKLESLLGPTDTESVTPLYASLLSIPIEGRYTALEMTPEQQKEQTLEVLVSRMEELSHNQPLLLIFEDVHWADPSSLKLLELTIARLQRIPVLAVITFRPEFSPSWSGYTHVTTLTLNRFTRNLALMMVDKVTHGKSLPEAVQQQIIEKTDGVPLFVEELTKTILESGSLTEESDQYRLSGSLSRLVIPATLHDSLMARLDRLARGKSVAQIGAAIGRDFSPGLLESVCDLPSSELDEALNELLDSGLVFRQGSSPGSNFIFKHALVQEVAYESLLHSTRKILHERIAQALLDLFSDTSESQPDLLAHHYTRADNKEYAIKYWLLAGQRAAKNSANLEAVGHLKAGISVLLELPESKQRAQQELDFQLALCSPLMTTRGWGSKDTAATYARVRELCTLLGETRKLLPVLNGEYMRELSLAHFQTARDKAAELLRLGEQLQDDEAILQGHRIMGWVSLYLGEFTVSSTHIDEVLRLYDPEKHEELKHRYAHDSRVAALCVRAILQSLCGYPDKAKKATTEALDYARSINHTPSLVYALTFAGALPATLQLDPQKAGDYAAEILSLSEQLRSELWLGFGRVICGWSAGTQISYKDGLQLLQQGLESLETTAPNPWRPVFLLLLAETHLNGDETHQALGTLESALQLSEQTGERIWVAGIHLLFGKAILSQDSNNIQGAEARFQQALDVATEQGAKSFEIRAATNLAGIWLAQGREAEAYKILAPVYEWFTEGFDTPDLIKAKKLLEQLT
jgi:predicted ATPase/class 3 adenylate cyclase